MSHAIRFLLVGCTLAIAAACADRLSLDSSGGGNVGPNVPPPEPSQHPTIGLVSAAGGPGMLWAAWHASPVLANGLEAAVFVASDEDLVFAAVPHALTISEGKVVVRDLPRDTDLFVGLGIRLAVAQPYTPSGPVLRVRSAAPIFVDVSADPAQSDGLTPETAFDDLLLGIVIADALGGGNVWVMEGDFENAAYPAYMGVHVLGGFARTDATSARRSAQRPVRDISELALRDEEFAALLAARAPDAHKTRLLGAAAQPIFAVESGNGTPAVIDGLWLDGRGVSSAGVDDTARPLELRSVDVQRCQRGIKLRPSPGVGVVRVLLTGVRAQACELEGVSVDGPFDVTVEAGRFAGNHNEGFDLNHLVAPDGATARLCVRGSSFDGNGTEGLDVHLGAPSTGGALGGDFEIEVVDCDFVGNALAGLRIDIDYETFPAWHSTLVIRGVRARANRGSGVHLDLDASHSTIVHRLSSTANAADGLLVTSESKPGTVLVSASLACGNLGAGVRASGGNVGVLASHCVIAGNAQEGFASEFVPSFAVSSVAYVQSNAWIGATCHSCAIQPHPVPDPFQRFPREFVRAVAVGANGLVVERVPGEPSGSVVELEDDGVVRTARAIAATTLLVEPAPTDLIVPASVALFAGTAEAGVEEDLRLTPNSSAAGVGMAPPQRAPSDAGPFGAPHGGAPGRESDLPPALFRLAHVDPPWTAPIDAHADLRLTFLGGLPEFASAQTRVLVVDSEGRGVPITVLVDQDAIVVSPLTEGWRGGEIVELHAGLRSSTGSELASPVAIPLRVR